MAEFGVREVNRTARKVSFLQVESNYLGWANHLPGSFNSPSQLDVDKQQPTFAVPVGKHGQTPMTVFTESSLLACNKQVSTCVWWRRWHEGACLNGRTQSSEQRSLTDMELQVKTQHCRNVCMSAASLPLTNPSRLEAELNRSSGAGGKLPCLICQELHLLALGRSSPLIVVSISVPPGCHPPPSLGGSNNSKMRDWLLSVI